MQRPACAACSENDLEQQEEDSDRQPAPPPPPSSMLRQGLRDSPAPEHNRGGAASRRARLSAALRGAGRFEHRDSSSSTAIRSARSSTDRHEAEAVRLGVFVASDGRHADAERHDERHGHRPRRHAAGVERDRRACSRSDHKRRPQRSMAIKAQQQPCAARSRTENAHHAQHQKAAPRRPTRSRSAPSVSISGTFARQHLQDPAPPP